MTVYVEDARIPATVGRHWALWSHLTADTDDELHDFAACLGLQRAWFQDHADPLRRHYDLTEPKRRAAIALGARPETWRAGARRRLASRQQDQIDPGQPPAPQEPTTHENRSTGHTAPASGASPTPVGPDLDAPALIHPPSRPSTRARRTGGTW